MCIAVPSSRENSSKMSFQDLLTKSRADSTHLTHQDMCMHVLKSFDQSRRSCKFLLKQMVMHQARHAQNSGSLNRSFEKLQAEHTQLQQTTTSERIEAQQREQELKNRIAAMANEMQEKDQKCKDQQRQIDKFREHFRQHPSSSHSLGSSSSAPNNIGRQVEPPLMHRRQPQPSSSENHAPPPPMHAFVKNKALAAAAAASSRHNSNERPILGQAYGNNNNYPVDTVPPFSATPIHMPTSIVQPSSGGSSNGPPRVRDIRSTTSYAFGGPSYQQRSSSGHSPALIFAKPQQSHQLFHGYR